MALPLSLRKRIAEFDPIASGKTISQFCKELGISRQTFYNIRDRIHDLGDAGVHPSSTRPASPHRLYGDDIRDMVADARHHLKKNGRDHGPWSIHYYLRDEQGLEHSPSRATIARMLDDLGLTDHNARKRPRAFLKRFARGTANELWQLDAMEYHLFNTHATTVTIYQLLDDATRFDLGTMAFADPENSTDACTTLSAAFTAYGPPVELLTDNGSAFATYRQGIISTTELFVAGYGTRSITGRPAHPTTQGKDERSHKTIRMYLNARTPTTLDEVIALLDDYREVYNTIRRHQGLTMGRTHLTPQQAWEIYEHAEPPTEPISPAVLHDRAADYLARRTPSQPVPDRDSDPHDADAACAKRGPVDDPADAGSDDDDIDAVTVARRGWITLGATRVYIGTTWKGRRLLIHRADGVIYYFTANDGEELCHLPDPLPPGLPAWVSITDINGAWHRKPPRHYNKNRS